MRTSTLAAPAFRRASAAAPAVAPVVRTSSTRQILRPLAFSEAANAPRQVVGIVIAALVLLPETFAAVRAARANRLQSSMNLAIGSALATTGLTVPVVAAAAIGFNLHLVLGLEPKDVAMLFLTFLVSSVTLGTGRTYVMQGAIHLVIFAAFLFLAFVP